jgi:hypothetical protein
MGREAAVLEHERDDFKACRGSRRRIAWMRLYARYNLIPLREFTACGVESASDARHRVRGIRAASGLEHKLVHTRKLA